MRLFRKPTHGQPAPGDGKASSAGDSLSIMAAETPATGLEERPDGYETASANSQWVYRCVDVLSRSVASLPVVIQTREPDGSLIDAPDHPAQRLMDTVNEAMSPADLWTRLVQVYLLRGECVAAIEWSASGQPAELWPLAPQWLRQSDRTDPERGRIWLYGRGIGAADRRFYADELIWWKRFNPADPSAPLSPLQSLTTALNSDYLAQQLNHAMLKNQARPDAVLTTQQPVPAAEARRIVGWWREALGRTDKSHRVIILPHGLEYREIQRTLADIEYVRGREITRDEILAVYGVPPILAGIIASGWGESEQVQRKLFWTDTVLTLCSQLDGLLTERGNELWPDNPPVFTRDLDSIESIIGQEAELVARYQPLVANGVMTINEMRGKLGLEPVPWGDVWWSSMGLSPVSGPERPSTAVSLLRGAQAPRHLEPLALGKAIRRWPSEVKWPRQLRKARRDSTDGLIEQWIPETEAQVVSLLESWKRDLEPTEEPYSRVKWHEKLRDLGDEMIGSMVWAAWVREDEVLAQVMKSWFPAKEAAPVWAGDGGAPEWVQDVAEITKPTVLIESPHAVAIMDTQAQRFATAIEETVWERVRSSVSDGIHNGETMRMLTDRINETMANYIQSSARTIARTETHGAMMGGMYARWQDGGEVGAREWSAAFRNTRASHEAAHAQVVGMDEPFTVGVDSLMYPGDPMGSAAEIINCECDELPVLKPR